MGTGQERGTAVSTGPGGFTWERDDWRDRAACQWPDRELFFPASANATRDQCAEALAICGTCRVAPDCLDYALRTRSVGVWGSTTEFEREVILRRERAAEREVAEVAS